ncbi:MAG TPA: PRC-barrel domain-containing protein [Longimicrobiales bacterium]
MTLVPLSERRDPARTADAPDVRAWAVVTAVDGERVGTVHDVLLDDAGRALYLDVDLGIFRKHVLVPIGQARVEPGRRAVRLPGFTRDRLEAIPAWDHRLDRLTRSFERRLVAAYARAYGGGRYRPRPPYAGAVYGPSELESPVRVEAVPALAPLSRLPGYRLAEAEPDPRGWTTLAADGSEAGTVEELIVDTGAMKVSHLAVRGPGAPRGACALVPAAYARLDTDREVVWLDIDAPDALGELPAWDGRAPPAMTTTPRARDRPRAAGEFYAHPRFSTRRFLGRPDR